MRYVAAVMLANLGGNHHPGLEDIKAILDSVGIECEEERAKNLLDQLKGKNAHDLIAAGRAKLSTVSVAAPAAHGAGSAPAAAASGAPAAAKEEAGGKKAEEKKPEPEEESDDDMGFSLFD